MVGPVLVADTSQGGLGKGADEAKARKSPSQEYGCQEKLVGLHPSVGETVPAFALAHFATCTPGAVLCVLRSARAWLSP